jgi:outer membrane protein assembly factor BamB
MHELVVIAVAFVVAGSVGCGKSGSGCGPAQSSEDSTRTRERDELNRLLGRMPADRDGRWGKIRAPRNAAEADAETQIRQLEALGYASGTKTAPSFTGVTLHDAERAGAGLNFYTSGHAAEAVLMTMDGRVVHRWARDFWDVFPGDVAEKNQDGTHNWRHAQPLENGDLLAIYEGLGLVKIDKDSNVIWARRNRAHHDFHVLPNGDIAALVRQARVIERVDPKRPTLEDFVVILDSTGTEKKRYSILEAFERSAAHKKIWDESTRRYGDIFHTNSIEALDGRFAAINPAFAKGNFLLSSRHLNTVFVVQPDTNEVVWALRGGFKAQHDAQLLADGSLLLFDNSGQAGRSAVQAYDPATRGVRWEYTGSEAHPFYSRFCGTAQHLPNDNTLITESDNGRAFEVTPDGTIVWEFYNPHRAGDQDEFIAALFQLQRLPWGHSPPF